MLECNLCLEGYHMKCLTPPLSAVPEGEWLCPNCVCGRPADLSRKTKTCRQKFLAGFYDVVRLAVRTSNLSLTPPPAVAV